MGLNDTPLSERVRIALLGCTNTGKSSLMNAITGQNVSIVSDVKGTTTDPVKKTMELLPLGPVVFIDTPGLDDDGILGEARIEKSYRLLDNIDIAVVVVEAASEMTSLEHDVIALIENKKIPYLVVYNKSDCVSIRMPNRLYVSALSGEGIEELKRTLASMYVPERKPVLSFDIRKDDIVVLVTPIDESAPKGRIILPQQMMIRELLDRNCVTIIVQPEQLERILSESDICPSLVVTDSQVFDYVKDVVPLNIKLTSFSILFANKKGFLKNAVAGVTALKKLKDGDVILISEACTHHRQCNDIGSVKIPEWIKKYTGKKLEFEFSSGEYFPDTLFRYSMVIHCGACMINDNMLKRRADIADSQNVPFTNFGILIAFLNNVLARSLEIFPEVHKLL